MNDLLASPWIPTVAMLLLSCGARLISRSWLAPGPFALLMWTIYLVFPLALTPEYPVPALGPWIILLLVLSIALGAHLGAGETAAIRDRAPLDLTGSKRMLRWSLVQTLLGSIGAVYWAGKALSENGLDVSAPGMLLLGHILSVERYAGEMPPLLARVLVMWLFPAALLSGIAFRVLKTRKESVLCFVVLIPTVFLSLMQASRANTLLVVALGLSGYLAMRAATAQAGQRLITRRSLAVLAASVLAGLTFFFVVDALRSHDQDKEIEVATDWSRARYFSLGYLAVFSHWANLPEGPASLHAGLGAYTFGGVLDSVGLRSRLVGVYSEYVTLEDGESNIYTAFRGLIEDFSLPGAAVFCVLVGFMAGRAYRFTVAGRTIWVAALAGYYVFVLWSPVISVFVYNSLILAIAAGATMFRRKDQTQGAASRELGFRPA
jgi:oligosaccharide repeat unit polymerase